jgi:hypothetical protein
MLAIRLQLREVRIGLTSPVLLESEGSDSFTWWNDRSLAELLLKQLVSQADLIFDVA